MQCLVFVGLVVIGGCFTSPPPSGPTQARPEPEDRRDEPPPPPPSPPSPGRNVLVFAEGTVHALRKCNAKAPPVLFIQAHANTRAVFAIAIELRHGPGDPVPRSLPVGGSAPSRCDPGCTGRVWLDSVAPGKRILGRLDLKWDDGRVARDRFNYEWRGGRWEVAPCPGPPDVHP